MIHFLLILLIATSAIGNDYIRLSDVNIAKLSKREVIEVKRTVNRLLLRSKKYQYLISEVKNLSKKQKVYSIKLIGDFYKWNDDLQQGHAISAILLENGREINKFDKSRVEKKKLLFEVQKLVLKLLSEKMIINKEKALNTKLQKEKKSEENINTIKDEKISPKLQEKAKNQKKNEKKNEKKIRKEEKKKVDEEIENNKIIQREKKKLQRKKNLIKKQKTYTVEEPEDFLDIENETFDIDLNNYVKFSSLVHVINTKSTLVDPNLVTINSLNYYGVAIDFDTAASYKSKSRFIASIEYLKNFGENNYEISDNLNLKLSYLYKWFQHFYLQFEISRNSNSFVNLVELGSQLENIEVVSYVMTMYLKFNGNFIRPYTISLGVGRIIAGEATSSMYTSEVTGFSLSGEVTMYKVWKKLFVGGKMFTDVSEFVGTRSYNNNSLGFQINSGYIF